MENFINAWCSYKAATNLYKVKLTVEQTRQRIRRKCGIGLRTIGEATKFDEKCDI